MNRKAVWGVFLLLSSGCGKSPAAYNANVGGDASIEMLRPGQYEFAFVRHVVGPGYPSEPIRYVDSICVTRGDIRHVGELLVPPGCYHQKSKVWRGNVSATMTCDFPELGASGVAYETHGTLDAESVHLTGEAMAHGTILHATYALRRKGDC